MKRFALLSHILPPSSSGQAIVLYRLLAEVPAEDYLLISRQDINAFPPERMASQRLPGLTLTLGATKPLTMISDPGIRVEPRPGWVRQFQRLIQRPRMRRLYRRLRDGLELLIFPYETLLRARQLRGILRQYPAACVVACSGDPYDLPAGYLASRWVGIPFVAYIFDDYGDQWSQPIRRRWARWAEPWLTRGANAVVVTNEEAVTEYQERHGVASVVIHNLCPVPDLAALEQNPPVYFDHTTFNLVYAGSIYHAQLDAFHNLLAALAQLNQPHIKLHLFTDQTDAELRFSGMTSPAMVKHAYLPNQQALQMLRQADVLFLPLAFHSAIQRTLKTAAPGKMGDYLAIGRAILVHAPHYTFVARYFRQHACGAVVDQPDVNALAQTLTHLLQDENWRTELGKRARQRAETDFALERVREQFFALLDREHQSV
ncbi:MAG: glycosyltransferase family 4 protein [Anaerolineae bacterium]|nr:glycosyltransferase family 4 protein [Anaerolineae bacterium]